MKKRVIALLLVALVLIPMLGVVTVSAAAPSELSNAFAVGTWPLAAGQYDPALDGQGIPDGTTVYGLFDSTYATLPVPSSVTGYTEVKSTADLAGGKYYVLYGSSGFNYVLTFGDPGAGGGGAAATSNPKTADATDVALFATILVFAIGGFVTLYSLKKRAAR